MYHKCILDMATNHNVKTNLTSNKHHCSNKVSVFCFLVADHVISRAARRALVNHCDGITSSAQLWCVHDQFSIVDVIKGLPLSHNATKGGVGPNLYNSVYRVDLEFLIAGEVISWEGERKQNISKERKRYKQWWIFKCPLLTAHLDVCVSDL